MCGCRNWYINQHNNQLFVVAACMTRQSLARSQTTLCIAANAMVIRSSWPVFFGSSSLPWSNYFIFLTRVKQSASRVLGCSKRPSQRGHESMGLFVVGSSLLLFRGPKDRTSGRPERCELRPWITLTWLCGQLLGSAPLRVHSSHRFFKKRVHSSHHSPLVHVLAVPPILCAVAPTGKLSRSMRRDSRKALFNAHVFILMQVDCNEIKLSFILIHFNTYELEWIHMHLKTLSQYHIVEPKIN
jgi:hypothetical protein